MNKSEELGIEWLKAEKSAKEEEILKSERVPRLALRGVRYEPRMCYGQMLLFSSKQAKELKDDDIIIVFNQRTEKFIDAFSWKKREKGFEIRIFDVDDVGRMLMSKELKSRIEELAKGEGEKPDKFLETLIEDYEDKKKYEQITSE